MAKNRFQYKGNPYNLILRLIESKKAFTYELTSSSGKVVTADSIIVFGDRWSGKTYSLFAKTKKELSKLEPPPKITTKIEYIGVKAPSQAVEVFDSVSSIDISAAYHSAARQLGYFSEELYKLHKDSNKMERLQAFGATAKRAEVFGYVNGELVSSETNESPVRNFFMTCAMYVSECLKEIRDALKDDFYFFWVDCIFFNNTPENVKLVKSIFEVYGFEYADSKTDFVIFETSEQNYKITRSDGIRSKEYLFNRRDITESERLIFENNKKHLLK